MAFGSSGSSNLINRLINNSLSAANKSNERLASGKRINRASDDAAGLAIANALTTGAAVSAQASRNVDFGQSAIRIADAAAGQVSEIGTRLAELSTQAANGTLSDEQRAALNEEYQALRQEAERITATTEFNGRPLLDGSNSLSIQVGDGSDSTDQISVENADLASVVSNLPTDISTQANAQAAIEGAQSFVASTSQLRGELGAASSRLEVAQNNLAVQEENQLAAASRIEDVDVANEAAKRVAANILSQAGTAVQAQANQSSSNVLRLLQS